jgi:NADPH:quinone reductase-like Zn-dependent oxidoreductase
MEAICVSPDRTLAVCDIPTPTTPAPGHILVDMVASAINHGDKAFLKIPAAAGNALALGRHAVWGASGAGRVTAVGAGVPQRYLGKQVALYRSLDRTPESIGLWCARAEMPYSTCAILPEHVRAIDYCGSLVNVMTAYAFLAEIEEAGHRRVLVTAGNSATGRALARLARHRGVAAIFLVRTAAARDALLQCGADHVIVTDADFLGTLATLSAALKTTAVFDGVGGALLGSILPVLPLNSTIYCYGFLDGVTPVSIPSVLLMMKNLTIRRFSNFESATVKHTEKRIAALQAIETLIDDPAFTTRLGASFDYAQVENAMAYASRHGEKALLIPSPTR